jgi:hypothetical protein
MAVSELAQFAERALKQRDVQPSKSLVRVAGVELHASVRRVT